MADQELASVKRANERESISREEFEKRIKIFAKSKRDISWWAENFFRIVTTSNGLQTIKLYQKQKELLQHLVDNDRNIVLASRQVGKCVFKDTKIKIKNKKTNEIQEISIFDFFKMIANKGK